MQYFLKKIPKRSRIPVPRKKQESNIEGDDHSTTFIINASSTAESKRCENRNSRTAHQPTAGSKSSTLAAAGITVDTYNRDGSYICAGRSRTAHLPPAGPKSSTLAAEGKTVDRGNRSKPPDGGVSLRNSPRRTSHQSQSGWRTSTPVAPARTIGSGHRVGPSVCAGRSAHQPTAGSKPSTLAAAGITVDRRSRTEPRVGAGSSCIAHSRTSRQSPVCAAETGCQPQPVQNDLHGVHGKLDKLISLMEGLCRLYLLHSIPFKIEIWFQIYVEYLK